MCSLRFGFVVLALLPAPALAQDLVYVFEGDSAHDRFGRSVCAPGDLDGDGWVDLVIAAPGDSGRQVRAFAGIDGGFLFALGGSNADGFGAFVVDTGDLDGDGVGDFAVSAPVGGYAKIYSGATRALIRRMPYARATSASDGKLARVPDTDGDGYDELAVGLPGAAGSAVCLHSGADGAMRWMVIERVPHSLGTSVASAGDVDGDGVADVVVGAPRGDGVSLRGAVIVLSGVDGSELHRFEGRNAYDMLGAVVAGLGDLDGDGRADFGAIASIDPNHFTAGPYLQVRSGADGSILHELAIADVQLVGLALARTDDVDGDDRPDFMLSGHTTNGAFSFLRFYSGADATLLWEITPPGTGTQALVYAGFVNPDGILDLLMGDPFAEPHGLQSGAAYVYSLMWAPLPERYCNAGPNSVGPGAEFDWHGTTSIGRNDLVLGARGCPDGQASRFFYGPTMEQVPFGDGLRCVGSGGLGLFRLGPAARIGAGGRIERALDLAARPASSGPGRIDPGSTWYFQFWYRDPAFGGFGFNLSDGLRVIFAP